jgi:hypothetical protein
MNLNKLPFFRFKLFRIGLGFLGLLALLYVFVFLRSIIPTSVYDKELQLERADIPDGSNAFDALQVASSHLWWPDDDERKIIDAAYTKLYSEAGKNGEIIPLRSPSIPKAVMDSSNQKNEHIQGYLMSTTNWDDQLAGIVLDNNRETLAAWDEAVGLQDLQVPEISMVTDLTPYLSSWKRLSQLAVVRENYLMHNGQEKAAFDQMVNQVMMGRKMQNSHSVLIGYLVGMAVNSMGLNQIQQWIGNAHLNPSQLKNYIRQLEFDPDDEAAAFANTMRAEYQSEMGTLDGLRKGILVDTDPDDNLRFIKSNPLLPVYNHSQTRALFANRYLVWLKAAPHHYNDAEDEIKINSAKLPGGYGFYPPGLISLILSGNAAGQVAYYSMLPALGAAMARKAQSDAQLQATRTILALRAYQLTHRNLPQDLSALVPEFLDEVPVDDFDGQPLRYSAERKIVYSVGKNLKDDGGDDRGQEETDSSQRHLDLVYKFDF